MDYPPDASTGQHGRIAIVTGANTGLGLETVLGLARTGMRVVMACRDSGRAGQARQRILQEVPSASLEVMQLDLASFAAVREFAAAFRATHPRLDLLVNNAGVMRPPCAKTVDGWESQFAVNHLGHFLLTSLLLDLLPDTPASRVVTLASIAHKRGRIRFDDLNSEGRGAYAGAYAQSKLACLMFSLELDRRLRRAGRRALSVAAHPGVCLTEMGRHVNRLLYHTLRYTILPFVTHPPAEGARSILIACLHPDVRGGQYFGPQGFREMKGEPGTARILPHALDEDAARRLWKASEEATECRFALPEA